MEELEKRDLYDKDFNLTGKTIYKGEPVPDDYYIIVVLVFILNSKNEFLIQKRSKRKDGKFASTGGHAKTGETSMQAMITEIEEEIGLAVTPEDIELVYSGREDSAHVFFDMYYMKRDLDINSLTLQESEVESVQWMTLDEVKQLIDEDLFLINHADEVFRMVNILKERGIDIEHS